MSKSLVIMSALLAGVLVLSASSNRARAQTPQVLVVPLTTADRALDRTATSLSQSLRAVVAARGGHPIEAHATRADIAAMTGCSTDDDECLQTIADAMGVTEVLLGSVEAGSKGGLSVSLTYYVDGTETRRERFDLVASKPGPATLELEPRANAFLAGGPALEPPPSDPAPPRPEDPIAPVTPAAPPPQQSAAFSFGRVGTPTYAVFGGGLALVGLGVIFYAVAGSKQDQVNDHPTETLTDLRNLEDLESSGKTFTTLGNVSMIVGGLTAVAGVSLIALQGSRKERGPTVTPMVVRGGAGVIVTVWGGR
ncbi:MAG TPA: hypothetical protein VML75_22250 [Kofleriaceae bacterium]|nr:hypothetical protein [Kofleriaceae bacterium]